MKMNGHRVRRMSTVFFKTVISTVKKKQKKNKEELKINKQTNKRKTKESDQFVSYSHHATTTTYQG